MHRHLNETVQWNDFFDNQFDKLLGCEKENYLMGDFHYCRSIPRKRLEYMELFDLYQIVMSTHRNTDDSETLIDHIYCNNLSNVLSTKMPILGLSDHFPVFITIKLNSP